MRYKNLSLEEKKKLLIGAEDGSYMNTESLGGKIYKIEMSDGPSGPHYSNDFTWMPSIANLASGWSEDMVTRYVDAIADQCIVGGADVLLGPSVNIKRLPVCGRNFEYFSEDPYLTGRLASRYIDVLQRRGVAATVKHYCANNREYSRLYSSSNMDERTLREIYVKAFEMLLKSDPWAIMCSYNAVNGVWAAENEHILKEILRDELGYENLIMSDWGAVHDRARSLKATLDLEMPFMTFHDSPKSISDGLESGMITEDDVDASVTRFESFTEKILAAKDVRAVKYTREERHAIAVEVAEEGIVLLKNEGDILPLKNGTRVAVVGEQAILPELSGGGSSNLGDDPENPFDNAFEVKQTGVHELLKERMPDSHIDFTIGYHCHLGFGLRYCTRDIDLVVDYTRAADVAVVFVGTNRAIESEDYDRDDLKIPSVQAGVLNEIIKNNENVVVVVTAGSVVDVSPFKDKVKAILYVPFGGEGVNEAISNILSGRVSPSGKLTETFISDMSVNPLVSRKADFFNENYDDGIFVGYRLYNTRGIDVEYPFGHGLSYTDFEYSDLAVTECENGDYDITFNLKNVGAARGKEISQLYIGKSDSLIDRALMELKGFEKTDLAPGESKTVRLHLERSELSYFDMESNAWEIESGIYKIMIGKSSRDLRLEADIEI
ncbi:MAG: glycoside hydrolase family 3 C-terminal domain-containing protein [Clostridia bacterium]|nr:glycoside hydrolase family 3 C-terminal domain-containing protein [Clostridia bacterium]